MSRSSPQSGAHAVERKFQLFAADSTDMLPAIADHPELIGREC